MAITAHKDFPHFFKTLSAPAFLTAWKGDVVRQGVPRWLSRPYRFTGIGSVFAGGRWNVKNLTPTLYASTTPAALAAEGCATVGSRRISKHD